MTSKRYFWLKLKEDFFDEKYIKALRRLPQGDSLAIVYLKMQLTSLKTEGIIKYEGLLPDSLAELAMALDEDENVVKLAVEALVRYGVVERWDNETLYMSAMQHLIGSESDSAARVRKHRALKEDQKALHGNGAVTDCNTEIDIDIELDKDKEKEGENKSAAALPSADTAPVENISQGDSTKKSQKKQEVRHKYGEYNNVLLTDTEMAKLIDEFPHDLGERIDRLSGYIESTGKKYKSHYATIRNWAKKDREKHRTQDVSKIPPKFRVNEIDYSEGWD